MKCRVLTIVLVAMFTAWGADDARGQGWQTRQDTGLHPGQRPTLSPYLDLLRANPGPLPNYYQFVRPKVQLQQQSQRQWQAIRHLQTDSRKAQPAKQLPSTGGGGHFQNYLHFYRSGTNRR